MQEVRQAAHLCKNQATISWTSLKRIVNALNEAAPPGGPSVFLLHEICKGSNLLLPPGRPPKPHKPELEARRAMLRRKLEDMQYADMVKDITRKEREAEDMRGALPTTQAQLTFGLHVLLIMFTGFATCYWGTKWFLGWDELWAGLIGAVGLAAGLFLETTLLIIRTNMPPSLEQQYPHLFDKKIWNKKRNQSGPAAGVQRAGKELQRQPPPSRAQEATPTTRDNKQD